MRIRGGEKTIVVKEKEISYFKKELSSSLSSSIDEEKMSFEEAPLHDALRSAVTASRSPPPCGTSLRLYATLRVTRTLVRRLTLQPVRRLLCMEEGKG